MTKERAWPAKAMYILLAAALAISLMIMAAPAHKTSAAPGPGLSEWTRVDTPTVDGWVLAPCSEIYDYALAEAGEVAYAVVYSDGECDMDSGYYLLKSEDYGATWDDITGALEDELDEEGFELIQVATDWVDPDFVAVALDIEEGSLHVLFSTDGGDTFEDIGEVEDDDVYLEYVSDLAVSYEAGGKRAIAIGGVAWDDGIAQEYAAGLFRCIVTGDAAGNWEDATLDPGWDNVDAPADDFYSKLVMDIIFSPSWATDKTILVTTFEDDWYDSDWPDYDSCGDDGNVYLQCGSWGTSEGWNEKSTLGIEAVPIVEDEYFPIWLMDWDARSIAGITLPEDYNSKNTDDRVLWVWVNYYDEQCGVPMCTIMRVDDDSADPVGPMGQIEDGELWLTNISYQGTIAEGEAIAGVLGTGTYEDRDQWELLTQCCDGVQVYRNDGIRNMDICCERWHDACKPPTGMAAMAVSYVGEDKAYAVALHGFEECGDESAWSVTWDDGDTWNQLSLIDTDIDYFSDVAVSPDCNKTFLVSVYEDEWSYDQMGLPAVPPWVCYTTYDLGGGYYDWRFLNCDSVWLHAETLPEAEEYSGQWLRTWNGILWGENWDEWDEGGMLRLAPDETTGDTVVLFDYHTSNAYWNGLETLACWDPIGSTELDCIVDLALQDADTLFAVDCEGYVSMFDDDEWQTAVDSEVDAGWTIAVWGDWILVGGRNGEVSYSDDGGETFTALEDVYGSDSKVTVAFDTYFDTNMTVYAAVEAWGDGYSGGIYSYVIDESEDWTDLKAEPLESQIFDDKIGDTDDEIDVAFTGLVVDRPGNPYTSPANGGVIYATYFGYYDGYWFTGVARSLERDVNVCTTCLQWDFLHVGLTLDWEGFEDPPDALKICGCLTPDSNTHLFAIDAWNYYDYCENEDGSVWTYEDCYAKKAPEITHPADGAVIPADPCSCYSQPFTVLWDSICDACSFDIAFAMDEDFTMPVKVNGEDEVTYHIISDTPSFSIMGGPDGGLSCETTYYVRIRAADAATGEIIHSWWSDPIAITISPSVEAGIVNLVAPAPGALNQPVKDVGFSWNLEATADAFDWVLSKNADLSSPLDSKTGLTSTATSHIGTLDYSTTYYWQVTAYNEGSLIGMSAVGTFTTMAEPEEPYVPPEAGTPMWVWIVIAIGAVLVIVVIVLIFRTRRV